MPLLTELEKFLVGPRHYKHAAPDGAIGGGGGYDILRLEAWNRRQQRTRREAHACGRDGNSEGIACVDQLGLRVRAEAALAVIGRSL
jgi:hypothetical protein